MLLSRRLLKGRFALETPYSSVVTGVTVTFSYSFRQAIEAGHKEYEKVTVTPVTTEEYGVSKAKRPFNSRLDKSKLTANGFNLLPTWQDAVKRYLAEIEF